MPFPRFPFRPFSSSSSSSSFSSRFTRLRHLSQSYRPYPYIFAFTLCLFKLTTDRIVYLPSVIGPSMSPSLSPSYEETGSADRILLWKVNPLKGLKRGDVVSIWKPHDPEGTSLKRVVALEGDVVVVRDRSLRRNGGGHARGRGVAREAEEEEEMVTTVRVPFGHVWVEGDNWRKSLDSNDFGPVSKSMVEGKAVCVAWPPERWGEIPDRRDRRHRTVVIEGPGKIAVPMEWE